MITEYHIQANLIFIKKMGLTVISQTLNFDPQVSPSRKTLNKSYEFFCCPSSLSLNNFDKPSTTWIILNFLHYKSACISTSAPKF